MIILCTFKNLLNNKKASKDIKKATKFLVEKKPSSKIGDIYTQIVMLNINMMLGGRGFAVLTLHVWQNDTFPKFVISFLT